MAVLRSSSRSNSSSPVKASLRLSHQLLSWCELPVELVVVVEDEAVEVPAVGWVLTCSAGMPDSSSFCRNWLASSAESNRPMMVVLMFELLRS